MTTSVSLRRRLVTRLALPIVLLFAISGAVSYWVARHYADRVYDAWLYDSVSSLAQEIRLSGGRVALDLPRAAQEIFEWDDQDTTLFRVVGARSGHIGGQADLPLQGTDTGDFRNARLFDAPAHGQPMRWAALDLNLQSLGEAVTVVVGETMRKREHLADEILLAVWFPQLALLLLFAWVTYGIISLQTEKIRTLSTTLRDFSYRNLQPVSGQDMPQELQPLVEALNAMIERLDHAALAQRTFVANAAHQLRTPLTALKMQAEQALRSEDMTEMRTAIVGLQAAADRAARLANQLLLLSRAEPDAQSNSSRSETDLYELAFETASVWVPAAIAANIDLGFDETSDHAHATIDASLVKEAIDNLLDNALKYCPPHSKVTVSVRRHPGPSIIVEDTGRGIPAAERSRVVQRFHRGDNASASGAGLGLSIVNEIALAHAGTFVIGDADGGGARFELRFPLD
jgi:two-component system, OmpR family, sensor histidine kinase TctE